VQCPACSRSVHSGERRCPECGADTLTSVPTEPIPASSGVAGLDFPPGASFAGRYTIVEKAGQGGMGVVYKAIDNSLDQVVALKLIQPGLAQSPAFVQRFKQEVRLTRQVAHANVCRVHDLGEGDGLLFLSMEWIDGVTLRRLLHQAALLEPARALEIARKILEGLNAAHARGIVHRDLKPENVMIDDRGNVFVMDFGLALGPGEGPESRGQLGTPVYMSPEQLRGDRVDPKADLYSLGLILQEMLTGRTSARGWLQPLPHHLRRSVGPVLEGMLAEDPGRRHASPEELEHAVEILARGAKEARPGGGRRELLRGWRRKLAVGAGGVALVLAIMAAYFMMRQPASPALHARSGAASPAPPEPGDSSPATAFYQRGLHYLREEGETASTLSQAIQMLNRAVEKDPRSTQAWAALAEAYWIRYERDGESSSREEARRAVEKATLLGPGLAEVHNARGRGLTAEGDFAAAVSELKQAVKLKPDFDTAWANLGIAYRELGDGYQPGLKALQTAIRLNPGSFRHQVYLGLFHYRWGEYDEASKAYRKALELRPDSVTAWENLGAVLLQMHRPEEATRAFLESLRLEDRPSARSNLGTAYYYRGEYELAVENYQRAAEIEPRNADYWGNLGDALRMLKRDDEALDAYQRAVRCAREKKTLTPQDPGAHMTLGLYCARAGEESCALDEGSQAEAMQPENLDVVFTNAVILSILGRPEPALDKLEKAVRLGLTRARIENDPDLIRLRDLPRYRRILELAG
jgi:serine/threonine-protein kinase